MASRINTILSACTRHFQEFEAFEKMNVSHFCENFFFSNFLHVFSRFWGFISSLFDTHGVSVVTGSIFISLLINLSWL
jgi:hypothetical protein